MSDPRTSMDPGLDGVGSRPAPKDTDTLDIFATEAKGAESGGKVIDLMEALKASLAKEAK